MIRDDYVALAGAVIFAAFMLMVAATMAGAAELVCPKRLACWQVRAAVATFGEGAAEAHVRSCGWSEDKIAEARKCLR